MNEIAALLVFLCQLVICLSFHVVAVSVTASHDGELGCSSAVMCFISPRSKTSLNVGKKS